MASEYCYVYVDDVVFVRRKPMTYLDTKTYEYNLMGIEKPEYYLEGDMETRKDGKMAWSAKNYFKM